MDTTSSTQNGNLSSSNVKVNDFHKKVERIDSRTNGGILIDIPASGISFEHVRNLPPDTPFHAKDPDGNINEYVVINNEIYKSANNWIKV